MPKNPEKFVLSSEMTIQTRRAQAVDPLLSSAIRRVCKEASQVAACYLLDGRRQDNGESGLIIALTVDENQSKWVRWRNNSRRCSQNFRAKLPKR